MVGILAQAGVSASCGSLRLILGNIHQLKEVGKGKGPDQLGGVVGREGASAASNSLRR